MKNYTVKRSKRKTLSIIVEKDGEILVLAPDNISDDEVKKLVKSKEFWIYKQLAEFELLNKAKIEREFVSGEGFLYLGRSYRLKIVETQDVVLKLLNGYFCLRRKDIKKAKEHFKEFYRKKGFEKITERVEKYTKTMGVRVNQIKIMELQSRWASCTDNKNLNFHWKCVMAPISIIDYIVVHELAHLIHPNHTEDFWSEIDKVLSNYQESKEWLKKFGAGLDI